MNAKEKYYKIIELQNKRLNLIKKYNEDNIIKFENLKSYQILNSDNEILIEINNLENQINKII